MDSKVASGVGHALVVCDHSPQIITRGRGGCQVDGIESSERRRRQSSSCKQQVSVDDKLVKSIEVSERNVEISADAMDSPQYFGDRQLASHHDIIITQSSPPLRNGPTFGLDD